MTVFVTFIRLYVLRYPIQYTTCQISKQRDSIILIGIVYVLLPAVLTGYWMKNVKYVSIGIGI